MSMANKSLPKVLLISFLLILSAFPLISGCGKRDTLITVAGSTSVQPIAEALAEEYMRKHRGVEINVQGGGSTAGIEAVKSGAANIGTSSRPLKGEEKTLKAILIAQDAIAIIVHPTNKVDNLSLAQIRKIFAGEIRNWRQLGGVNKPITIITREEGSGTRGAFEGMVMKGKEFSVDALVQDSTGAIRETVAGDKNAIGYISLGMVDKRVKAIKIEGKRPTVEAVLKKEYTLARPFLFVLNGEPKGKVKEFIDFVLSPWGQKLIEQEGFVRAK